MSPQGSFTIERGDAAEIARQALATPTPAHPNPAPSHESSEDA